MRIALSQVRIDGGTQSRVAIHDVTVADYCEAITAGADLPPATLFFDGADYWLADGFHRFHAYKQSGAIEMPADIQAGSKRDAILYSAGANASHGLRRSNEDKRKAVMLLLNDPEWSDWSDNAIAKQCHVDHKTVTSLRNSLGKSQANLDSNPSSQTYLGNSQDTIQNPSARKCTRNGKVYSVDTTHIGTRNANAKPKPESNPATPETAPGDAAPESDQATPEIAEAIPGRTDAVSKSDSDPEPASEIDFDAEAAFEAEQSAALIFELRTIAASDDQLAAALETVEELTKENAMLKAQLRTVESTRDGYMNSLNEHIRMVKSRNRKIELLEKQLKTAGALP